MNQIVNFSLLDYNPYKNILQIKQGLKNLRLFSDKLQDLNGYPLIFDIFAPFNNEKIRKINKEILPANYLGRKTGWNFAKYIVDATNCSAVIRAGHTKSGKIRFRLRNDKIDIVTEDYSRELYTHDNVAWTNPILLNYRRFVLCVRQFGYYKKLRYHNFVVSLVAFVFIIFLFFIISKLFKLNLDVYDITMILMGRSLDTTLSRAVHYLIYLLMLYVSVSFISDVIDQIFSTNFYQKNFYEMFSLDDVVHLPFNFSTTTHLYNILNKKTDPVYKQMKNKVNTVHRTKKKVDCFYEMYTKKDLNLCYPRYYETIVFKVLYENYFQDDSILTIVDEPILHNTINNFHMLSRITPYLEKINNFFYKVVETGLHSFWVNMLLIQQYAKKNHVKFLKTPVHNSEETKNMMLVYYKNKRFFKKQQLDNESQDFVKRLLFTLLTGLLISALVFIVEFRKSYCTKFKVYFFFQ